MRLSVSTGRGQDRTGQQKPPKVGRAEIIVIIIAVPPVCAALYRDHNIVQVSVPKSLQSDQCHRERTGGREWARVQEENMQSRQ